MNVELPEHPGEAESENVSQLGVLISYVQQSVLAKLYVCADKAADLTGQLPDR
jgi:hypothetical protein